MAHAYAASDRAVDARRGWSQALDRYTELGLPEAGEVRARLSAPLTKAGSIV